MLGINNSHTLMALELPCEVLTLTQDKFLVHWNPKSNIGQNEALLGVLDNVGCQPNGDATSVGVKW